MMGYIVKQLKLTNSWCNRPDAPLLILPGWMPLNISVAAAVPQQFSGFII